MLGSMIKPRFFFAAVAALLALSIGLANPSPTVDSFSEIGTGQSLALDQLAVEDIAALKLHHVLARPPYDALLLGNSRSLPLRAADLGLDPHGTFNLALTGESLRSSTLLLEWLADAGRLPRLALISFDHAELNYYGNPNWAPRPVRWFQLARDLEAGLRRPAIPVGEFVRMALRHITTEATLLSRDLSFSRVRRGVSATFARLFAPNDLLAPRAPSEAGYQADGSRPHSPPGVPFVPAPLPVPNRNVLTGYLDYDLERIAAVAAKGTRIVIYETPLFPEMQRAAMARPSPVADETRAGLLRMCARHGLECHASPSTFDDFGLPWPDAGHPPAAALAAWIQTLIVPTRGETASR